MPSFRRMRTVILLAAVLSFAVYYLTRSDPSAVDFRARTLEALNRQSSREDAARDVAKGGLPSDFRGASRSRNQDKQAPLDIPVPAKDAQKAAGDKSMAGRKQPMGGERWDMATGKEAPMHRDKEEDTDDKREETPEEHEVETELNSILKRGPIIIFSKSYCPHSAVAKRILLEKYSIVPAPVVIELDQHDLGTGIQAALAKGTGRRTVPNVLVSGKSIGGGDEIEELDQAETCKRNNDNGDP